MAANGPTDIARKYLRLHLCRGVGPIRSAQLVRELGGIDAVLGASVAQLASVRGVGPQTAESIVNGRDISAVDAEVDLAMRKDVQILCIEDVEYPALLRRIEDPPACLYVRGTLEAEDAVSFGIVGARHATHYGVEQAERFGARAAAAGMTVISGMARGIDTAAHHGALVANGRTIAIIGCGLSYLYPPDAVELAERIEKAGAILSELPMDVAPDPKNFPPRNRIIAGLSLGILVVEAAQRSGALITARLATEYNREVFVLPGRVDMPQSAGCHNLIRKGEGQLVTCWEDVLDGLGEVGDVLRQPAEDERDAQDDGNGSGRKTQFVSLNEEESSVFDAIGDEPAPVEAICEASGLGAARVAIALTTLQLKGVVRRAPGELFYRAMG
ncbi:MAG: DNA-protecting protein DprA [Phycisphaerales bacterium]|nr:DNA-protecting protein DprA [Phycisphaerales bacterium]MCB9863648.1 DNA-protecting protein DprA [Phycisphaerales bacterium]